MKRAAFFEKRQCKPLRVKNPSTGCEIVANPQRDAIIGPNLDEEICRLPGLYGWYAQLRDNAKVYYNETMHAEHNTEEELYKLFTLKAEKKGEKKTTETSLKMQIKAHDRMREAYRLRMEAQAQLAHLESAVQMIEYKKWCLQSLVKLRSFEFNLKDSI